MSSPPPPPSRTRWYLIGAAALLLVGAAVVRRAAGPAGAVGAIASRWNRTSISQSVVVERVQAVAKLVSSETSLRDVVVYENTWMGSTKRSLVVVSGKVLAGIDLAAGADVRVDDAARRITITLPHASVLAVDITGMSTYDERRGLWNPFVPQDRDLIYQQARTQLLHAANELRVAAHAEESAKRLLEGLFTTDGYTAEVTFVPRLEMPTR